ncbi:MAG TPA: hypothetical protein VK662_14030 [Acidothermaceae bacterium]|nr:hypothetical protein [Acidothermaceae bacterium]
MIERITTLVIEWRKARDRVAARVVVERRKARDRVAARLVIEWQQGS